MNLTNLPTTPADLMKIHPLQRLPRTSRSRLIPVLQKSTLGLAALLAVLAGCGRGPAQQSPPPPCVTVAPAETQEIVESAEFTGRIEPVESVEVRPRVSGYIQKVEFQSGQMVKKGDVLFLIDPRWHQAAFDQRQAEFAEANVRLENAKREADRSAQLLANKAISTEDSDARQSRFAGTKAALLAAQAALDSARLDLASGSTSWPMPKSSKRTAAAKSQSIFNSRTRAISPTAGLSSPSTTALMPRPVASSYALCFRTTMAGSSQAFSLAFVCPRVKSTQPS
jgi:multidrug efflux pump subunit AcrA (membrane-fusion protein)